MSERTNLRGYCSPRCCAFGERDANGHRLGHRLEAAEVRRLPQASPTHGQRAAEVLRPRLPGGGPSGCEGWRRLVTRARQHGLGDLYL